MRWSGSVTCLVVGLTATAWSGVLWVARRGVLQNVALFAALVVTVVGTVLVMGGSEPSELAFAAALGALGAGWAVLGSREVVEPAWVTLPLGTLLALLAPSLAAERYGWMQVVGVLVAAAGMAAGVGLRDTVILVMGAVAMFCYVTSVVVRYFSDTLGAPAALAITGLLIIVVAAGTARLLAGLRPRTASGGRHSSRSHVR
jgi:hypothetical protein